MSICEECAMRLFNIKQHNLQGVGNPSFGKCIVIPNVDYVAYKNRSIGFSEQVKIIEDILNLATGELDILNSLYIVPLIRCCDKLGCQLTDDIYNKCITYFANDVRRFQFTDIMLLGEAGRKFLHCDISENDDYVFISPNKRKYVINYSPLTKYTNADLFETFKVNLIKWFNSAYNGYCGYRTQFIQ